jgi:alkaline phosphatase
MLLAACLISTGILPVAPVLAQEGGRAKYVFLMIGDGMGSAHRTAAELFLSGPQEKDQPVHLQKLVMNTLPVCGLARTWAYDGLVTDSGAAATAMATGQKALRAALSVDPVDEHKLKTLAETAKERGWKVGIVTSAAIDDATPAAFYAHQASRGNFYEIAMELAASNFDYFAGGGPAGAKPERLRGRPSPIEAARKNGFRIVTTKDELLRLRPGAGKVWAQYPLSEKNVDMDYEMDRPADRPALVDLTRKAIELLDNPTGFFIMVEGGKIDEAAHVHDAAAMVGDVLAFDRAVAEALAFHKKHPNETLLVVTADHETGGLGLGSTKNYDLLPKMIAGQKMSHERFEARIAEFRAKGTTFEQALPVIQETFGFENLTPLQTQGLARAYDLSMKEEQARPRTEETIALYYRYEPLSVACGDLLSRLAGLGWPTLSHTGVPVPTSAIGAGQEKFNGYYENTDIFKNILSVMAPSRELVPAR